MHNIILGFDFGLKRIGVAVGQRITKTATPLDILKAENGIPNWDIIAALIAEWGVDALVVGLPMNMDQTEQPFTQCAREFGYELEKRFRLPIFFADERLTTIAAKLQLYAEKNTGKADSVAAKLIVESWMCAQEERENH